MRNGKPDPLDHVDTDPADTPLHSTQGATQRLDVWLWRARFFKSRSLATKLCVGGRVRVDGELVAKAHHAVREGRVLTFPQGAAVRVVRVVALAERRGPAPEARTLYEDLSPPPPASRDRASTQPLRDPGAGRPTKRDRRAIDRLLGER